MELCRNYLVTIYERWDYGTQWSYKVRTNNIEYIKESLKEHYNRFTVEII